MVYEWLSALTTLRNQLTIKHDEATIAHHDERLNLCHTWLQASPGAQDLFDIWESTTSVRSRSMSLSGPLKRYLYQRQISMLSLVVAVMSSFLSLLTLHHTDHALTRPIFKTLLSPQWMHRLNSYLGGSNSELILVTLKLLNSMSHFANGRERPAMVDAIAWDTKVSYRPVFFISCAMILYQALPKLLYMRRKVNADDNINILARPGKILTFFMNTASHSVGRYTNVVHPVDYIIHREFDHLIQIRIPGTTPRRIHIDIQRPSTRPIPARQEGTRSVLD